MSAFDRQLQLVTGKGGVGKSSLVAALAMRAARRGGRPLIVELGHRATMQSLFDVAHVGFDPVLVAPSVHALNIELDAAIRDYIIRFVRLPRLVDRVLGNAALRRFFDAAPGVAETVTLGRLQTLCAERVGERPRWDPVLVDLDATGHALMLLELPRVFEDLLGRGPLRRLMQGAARLLSDPARTALHLVATPRPIVVQETRELYRTLTGEHSVALGAIFVNQMPARPLPEAVLPAFEALRARGRDEPGVLGEAVRLTEAALARYRQALELSRALSGSIPLPQVLVPEVSMAGSPGSVAGGIARALGELS